MKSVFSTSYVSDHSLIDGFIASFDHSGKKFDERNRNTLKLFQIGAKTINIKSFKVPNLINRVAYKTLRSSKAARSFEYAHKLLDLGIKTPQPIAYYQEEGMLFGRSFYVSNHLDYDLTYRELCHDSIYVGNEEILSAFARFTYTLHQKGVYFLDHSPGNTLIVITQDGYDFYLVDLNRMKFGSMDFETRIKNFERLSHRPQDIAIMARAYAQVSAEDPAIVEKAMNKAVQSFQEAFHKKQRLKKKLRFWRKDID